jgi:hypothetical protein
MRQGTLLDSHVDAVDTHRRRTIHNLLGGPTRRQGGKSRTRAFGCGGWQNGEVNGFAGGHQGALFAVIPTKAAAAADRRRIHRDDAAAVALSHTSLVNDTLPGKRAEDSCH